MSSKSISFENIHEHVIPINQFRLKWRFTDNAFDQLPEIHLTQLKPLDTEASRFLWNYISDVGLHANFPFRKDFFPETEQLDTTDRNKTEIRKWLLKRRLPDTTQVFLSWQPEDAMIVPWELLIKYFDSFYYSTADDLTVIDQSLNWALLFYHENEIYFGQRS